MDWYYITAASLPRLSLVLLTAVLFCYFASRVRKAPGTAWLAMAMVGFALHHASFAGFYVLNASWAQDVLTPLTWSSVVLATWAFIGVAYGFRGAGYTPGARRVLAGTGLAAAAAIAFVHVEYASPAPSGAAVQLVGTATVIVFSVCALAILGREARRQREAQAPDASASSRKALRTFGAIILCGLIIPVVGLFRDTDLISLALDEQIALVVWAVVMMGLVTLYVNYDSQPTSFVVKVVAFGFLAVVTSLGVASVVAFAGPPSVPGITPQSLAYVLEGDRYRTERGSPLVLEDGDPIDLEDGEVSRVELGFEFPFGGQAWSEVLVDDDGSVSFGADTLLTYWDIVEGSDAGWIAPLRTSLAPTPGSVSVARAPGRASITWRDVPVSGLDSAVTVQLQMKQTGSFSFAYGEIGDDLLWSRGFSPGGGRRPRAVAWELGVTVPAGDAALQSRSHAYRSADQARALPYLWLLIGAGLSVLAAFPLYLREGLTRPLQRLVDGVRRAARGHLDTNVPVGARDEIGLLTEDFNVMAGSLRTAESELRAYADTLEDRVEERTAELEASLDELRAAQARLIQQEKLASLGQLTAGIAHEIKNPLNFVTNFASLSVDLVADLEDETDPEERAALLDDLKLNAEKIAEHGRRADGIVRSMMDHARSRGGERERTDLNALVQEYAALAYHGTRARHPNSTTRLVYDLEDDAGSVEVVGPEMGRVLINLIDNAFDAVRGIEGRDPLVTVATRRHGDAVEIRISDNGAGMPPDVRERVFEPFFTTKPTGSGTGLGLSIGYDIVAQGHGGTLEVESAQGEGTTFTITLPV
ncbi:sensor histidine kinase [Rubrivirga sp.]|uniref:sensor histidine kinase n=1 Tax=Rubrivirga sp. TaxID=1885344 RepID=UPI003C763666